jgi:hypothetical protein
MESFRMHNRRIACFFVGLWLGGTVLLTWVASDNLRAIERMIVRPTAAAAPEVTALGPERARTLLTSQATLENHRNLQLWETVQLILGVGFLLFLVLGTHEKPPTLLLATLMLIMVAVQLFVLETQFNIRYVAAESLKWGTGVVLAGRLIIRRSRSGDTRQDFDLVDKADHRHVNR